MTHRLGGSALALLVALVTLAFPTSAQTDSGEPPGVSALVNANDFYSNALDHSAVPEAAISVDGEARMNFPGFLGTALLGLTILCLSLGVLEVTPFRFSRRLTMEPGGAGTG